MLSFTGIRYYNGTTKSVNYVGTTQPDGYVYFNDNRFFRGRYNGTTITDIQVKYDSKEQWIRTGMVVIDNIKPVQEYDPTQVIVTGNVREVINLAESQIGSNGYTYWTWYSDNVSYLGPYINGGATPYCAVFISWLLNRVGATSSYFPNAAAFDAREIPASERIPFSQLQTGDIVSFDWNGDSGGDHVGIVESNDGNIITTIEGNTGEYGYVLRRERTSSNVLFGIRPIYRS